MCDNYHHDDDADGGADVDADADDDDVGSKDNETLYLFTCDNYHHDDGGGDYEELKMGGND